MRLVTYFILMFGSFSLLSNCKSVDADSTTVDEPKKYSELRVYYQYNAGMLPESEHILISSVDTSYRIYKKDFEEKKSEWVATKEELDVLYQKLVEQTYWKITSQRSNGVVFDRGGVILTISVDGKQYEINNAGNSFVEEKWYSHLAAIEIAIKTAAAQHE